jgi:hypothetical protein
MLRDHDVDDVPRYQPDNQEKDDSDERKRRNSQPKPSQDIGTHLITILLTSSVPVSGSRYGTGAGASHNNRSVGAAITAHYKRARVGLSMVILQVNPTLTKRSKYACRKGGRVD